MDRIENYVIQEVATEVEVATAGPPAPGIMQVFFENGVPVRADFLCPCGCGHRCPTRLATPDRPKKPGDGRWNFSVGKDGRPTLSPSIRWTTDCKAHFTITDGKVKMEGDSGR